MLTAAPGLKGRIQEKGTLSGCLKKKENAGQGRRSNHRQRGATVNREQLCDMSYDCKGKLGGEKPTGGEPAPSYSYYFPAQRKLSEVSAGQRKEKR